MKQIKLLISVLLIVTIALVSCKKDSSTGPGAGGDLVGIWNIIGGNFGWVITTNSNQTAINMFDITGQINIDGTPITMDFMYLDNSGTDPSFTVMDAANKYSFLLEGNSGTGTLINNGELYTGIISYSFDGTTLVINESTMQHITSDVTVIISGSISYNITNIPANTPTLMQFTNFDDGDDVGLTTIEFKSDGTVTVTDVYEGVTDTETWSYTTSGSQLTVTDEFGDTMTYDYSVTGNTMIWNATDSESWCEDSATQTECFAGFEESFNLDAGSVTNIGSLIEFVFSKAVAKPGLNIGKAYNLMNPTKVIFDYKLKIDNLKKKSIESRSNNMKAPIIRGFSLYFFRSYIIK